MEIPNVAYEYPLDNRLCPLGYSLDIDVPQNMISNGCPSCTRHDYILDQNLCVYELDILWRHAGCSLHII